MGFFDSIGAIAAPIAAGFNLISGIDANRQNVQAQRDINADNLAYSREQTSFQREMSDTAHQREVRDLQAAGLNPILSAGGNGSSTPAGAAPNLTAPQVQAPQIHLPDMMAYGISLKQLEQADQRLAIDRQNSAASVSKNLSDLEINKMKKILLQKGMPRAQLEGEASGILQKAIEFLRNSARKVPDLQKGGTKYPIVTPR